MKALLLRRELICGAAVLALALFAGLEAARYNMGSATRMGPGFLPMAYAMGLGFLGLALLVTGWPDRSAVEPMRLRPLLAVCGAMLAWVYLAPRLGFLVATVALVFISAGAERDMRPLRALLLGGVAALVGGLVFIRGFGVPLPMFPRL